jgi:hypothetical protein
MGIHNLIGLPISEHQICRHSCPLSARRFISVNANVRDHIGYGHFEKVQWTGGGTRWGEEINQIVSQNLPISIWNSRNFNGNSNAALIWFRNMQRAKATSCDKDA